MGYIIDIASMSGLVSYPPHLESSVLYRSGVRKVMNCRTRPFLCRVCLPPRQVARVLTLSITHSSFAPLHRGFLRCQSVIGNVGPCSTCVIACRAFGHSGSARPGFRQRSMIPSLLIEISSYPLTFSFAQVNPKVFPEIV